MQPHTQTGTRWASYLLHSCTQNIIPFVEGHLNRAQELQPVSVHPLAALYCTGKTGKKKMSANNNERQQTTQHGGGGGAKNPGETLKVQVLFYIYKQGNIIMYLLGVKDQLFLFPSHVYISLSYIFDFVSVHANPTDHNPV